MGSSFHNAPLLKHTDKIGILYGRKSVGYDKCGSAAHKPVHTFLNDTLGSGIYGAGCLIQYQYRRICDSGSRNGKELTLTLTQVCTITGKHGVITIG